MSEFNDETNNNTVLNTVLDWIETIVMYIFVVILIFSFVLRVVVVEGKSMMVTLYDKDLLLVTKNGMSIHFETKSISAIGRVASGVKGIKLAEEDEVLIGLPIKHQSDKLAVFSSNGLAKKTVLSEFSIQGRGGKGIYVYKPCSSAEKLVGAALISDEDNILLVGNPNSICIAATDIPELSRTSMGNMMIKNSKVVSIVKL